MKVTEITAYSDDYIDSLSGDGIFYCSVRVDFDFVMSLPDMENRVYYRKKNSVIDRLNNHGIFLMIWYQLMTKEIMEITVKFDNLCQVPYRSEKEMEEIVRLMKLRK